ncbi:hypothetical protein MOO45_00325 [Bombilactobacillus folatiphilus]|uniref:Uncharacterized protein n=1 Tax=Bombilactobacillus folatiphilus TaxID=2923362 RepID=A0ABY4P9F5_9LACO|nr:hypothetical protein [Bombilactobacillus folatiphilus]UQS82179.1 hypothetical protein MOO45_00325 [Bombilactobacillus folatiphilus]
MLSKDWQAVGDGTVHHPTGKTYDGGAGTYTKDGFETCLMTGRPQTQTYV